MRYDFLLEHAMPAVASVMPCLSLMYVSQERQPASGPDKSVPPALGKAITEAYTAVRTAPATRDATAEVPHDANVEVTLPWVT